MSLFISQAHAAAAPAQGADGMSMLIMLAVFGKVMKYLRKVALLVKLLKFLTKKILSLLVLPKVLK